MAFTSVSADTQIGPVHVQQIVGAYGRGTLDVDRLRERAGCYRSCSLTADTMSWMPRLMVVHNGVSWSHRTAIDLFIVRTAAERLETVLTAWLKAHHDGHHGEFSHQFEDGSTVTVPEYDDA